MERIVKVTVPRNVYQFYQDAARHVADSSPEDIMSDALCGYAGLLSQRIAKEREKALTELDTDTK